MYFQECAVSSDAMSLKKFLKYCRPKDKIYGLQQYSAPYIATHVMVIFARSIYSKWKQPICYYFIGSSMPPDEIKNILCATIQTLLAIGLRVRSLTSDQGADFFKTAKLLGVSVDHPYFEVGGHVINFLFDVPHLIKSCRNNLLKSNFTWASTDGSSKRVSFKYIEKFYQIDSECEFRAAPKLTRQHIEPTSFERMRVCYAAQVLSHSVSSGMKVLLKRKLLPPNRRTP